MEEFVEEILFTNEEIAKRCAEIGKCLTEDYKGKRPLVVGMLKGAVPFLAELIKHVNCDMDLDFLGLSSYSGTQSTGNVIIYKDIDQDLVGRDILIVEDIVDTGITMKAVIQLLSNRGANSVQIVSLLNKEERREVEGISIKYSCFPCPNKFVIGFGLDYNGLYRNLPYIGVLKKCMYEN